MPVHVIVTGKYNHRGSDGLKFLERLRDATNQTTGTRVSLCLSQLPPEVRDQFPEFLFLDDAIPKYGARLLPTRDIGGRSLRYQSADFLRCAENIKDGSLVIRLRVDLEIVSIQNLAKFLRESEAVAPRIGQLYIAAEGTRNFKRFPAPFFFSDLIQFGLREEVVRFWKGAQEYERTQLISHRTMWTPSFTPGLPRSLAPEQFAYGLFLLRKEPSSTHPKPNFVEFRTTLRAIGDEIVLLPLDLLGLALPPNWIPSEWINRKFVFSSYVSPIRFPNFQALVAWIHARFMFWTNPLWWRMGRYPISRLEGKLIWTYSRYTDDQIR
jgi:hypothetical protein